MQRISSSVEWRAQFILLKGAALKFLGRPDDALALLRQIVPLQTQVHEVRTSLLPSPAYDLHRH
jgi:hypothetical protein